MARLRFRQDLCQSVGQQNPGFDAGNKDWLGFLRAICQAPELRDAEPCAAPPKPREAPRPKPLRAPFAERFKDNVRRFLRDVLPDPPEAISAEEISETFTVSAAGDNEVFKARTRRVEIVELYFSMTGGANTIIVKVGGIVLYDAQAFSKQGFLSTPPFELLPQQNIVLNLLNATAVVGRVRYVIEEPFRHVEGKA